MSTTKHTPGPWRVECQNGSPTTGEWMIAGAKPGYLAEVRDCGSGCASANARLIAAAPELLEVCEKVSALYGRLWDVADQDGAGFLSPESVKEYDEAHRMIFAAIAKAKGES